jgi:hypothetical protein
MAVSTDNPQDQKEVSGTVSSPSTEVTKRGRAPSALDRFFADAKDQGGDVERDPMESIIRQVLSADSPASVLTPTEVMKASDMVGIPLLLVGFELNESEYDAGSPMYGSMAVLVPGGQPTVVNCGHKKVLAQLVKLQEFNEFPYRVIFVTRGTSKQGTPMLELNAWTEEQYADNPPF